jgi:hypothetical protein
MSTNAPRIIIASFAFMMTLSCDAGRIDRARHLVGGRCRNSLSAACCDLCDCASGTLRHGHETTRNVVENRATRRTRAICAQQAVTANPVFVRVVSTKSGPIGSPDWGRGRPRNKCLPHKGESSNVAGRTREYRGGLQGRSGRSDRAAQKPGPTRRCRERRWQKTSSWASLLDLHGHHYSNRAPLGTRRITRRGSSRCPRCSAPAKSPMQCCSEKANHRRAYRNLNHGVMVPRPAA